MDILTASWRLSTKKQYQSYISRWIKYCREKELNYISNSVENVLEFLSDLFHNGQLKYSAINTARSALSAFLTLENCPYTVGTHPLIGRFMKGIFQLNPPQARYSEIWDVQVVFNYLRRLSPAKTLSLKNLTLKLSMLLALISAQRVQSLHLLNLDNMIMKEGAVIFSFSDQLKQNAPGRAAFGIRLPAYPPDRRLCIVTYLKHYIQRTSVIRGTERYLLISFKKPCRRISSQTISRWIKTCMNDAGIDTSLYKAHSTRAAATSAAASVDLPLPYIMAQAGWANEKTFQKFYRKPVLVNQGEQFSSALLTGRKSK